MSHLAKYAHRTARILRDETSKILRMAGAEEPPREMRTIFTFNSGDDIQQFATGSDQDVGGLTTASLQLDTHNRNSAGMPTAKFWGAMKLHVRPDMEGKLRPGYAGFRNKRRPTLFGDEMEDLSNHSFLGLRLRCGGDIKTRDCYFVNLQTDGAISTDLWQHRLYFKRQDGGWEDIHIPLDSFVLTNSGELSEHQIKMYTEKIRSIGISMLGGNSNVAGHYELGIDAIWAANEEDIHKNAPSPDSPSL